MLVLPRGLGKANQLRPKTAPPVCGATAGPATQVASASVDAAEPRSRWRPVLAYAALSAANQMLWLTFTPLTTGAARHYGVSSGAVGWLAELFPLLYVVLALPAGRLVDRNLPLWLGIGAALDRGAGPCCGSPASTTCPCWPGRCWSPSPNRWCSTR